MFFITNFYNFGLFYNFDLLCCTRYLILRINMEWTIKLFNIFCTVGGELCLLDLYNLWKWTPDPNLNLKMDQNLSSQGYKDHFFLAQRLKNAFPNILKINPKDVKPGTFVVNKQLSEFCLKCLINYTISVSINRYPTYES